MSGPKVVRIVSREEIEALCRAQMRDVSRAAAALVRTARRHDRLDAEMEADLARRTVPFETMFAGQLWMDIQKRGREEVAFLRGEASRIEAEAVRRALEARSESRRVVDAARSVVAALEASGAAVDAKLRSLSDGAVPDLAAARAVVERSLVGLRSTASASVSAASKALAGRLSAGGIPRTLDEWAASQLRRPDPSNERIDAALSELATIVGSEAATAFEPRAAAIAAERDAGRRSLLSDSLVLEAGAFVAAHRAAETRRERLEAAVSSLEALDAPRHADLIAGLRNAGVQAGATDDLIARAEGAFATETVERAATARRRAVLDGLADLGYEVRRSMSTSLAENGRVLLRKPAETDYGVEVSMPAGGARMQIRLVGASAPSTPRSTARDRDRETSWCDDVSSLQKLLGAAGTDFSIERALAAGAEPLKSAALGTDDDVRQADLSAPIGIAR